MMTNIIGYEDMPNYCCLKKKTVKFVVNLEIKIINS